MAGIGEANLGPETCVELLWERVGADKILPTWFWRSFNVSEIEYLKMADERTKVRKNRERELTVGVEGATGSVIAVMFGLSLSNRRFWNSWRRSPALEPSSCCPIKVKFERSLQGLKASKMQTQQWRKTGKSMTQVRKLNRKKSPEISVFPQYMRRCSSSVWWFLWHTGVHIIRSSFAPFSMILSQIFHRFQITTI